MYKLLDFALCGKDSVETVISCYFFRYHYLLLKAMLYKYLSFLKNMLLFMKTIAVNK